MPDLATVISAVESNSNPLAMKFEAALFNSPDVDLSLGLSLIPHIANVNACDRNTARMIAASRWGEFQLMGFNIYRSKVCSEIAAQARIMEFLSSRVTQLVAFQYYLRASGIHYGLIDLVRDHAKLVRVATLYNGPGNVDRYSMRLLDEIRLQQPELFAG